MLKALGTRPRWVALGAAIAISLGAGGVGVGHATVSSGERTVFVPITPCRLADTRAAAQFHVGPATTLAADAAVTFPARGTNGNCTLPAGASGLALNVTAVDPTAATFLTVYPAAATRPVASNLNPSPGSPPVPNAVAVDLDDAGAFAIYNRFGTVDVIVDVVGYYEDHNHDDRYYTKPQVDAAIGAAVAEAGSVRVVTPFDASGTGATTVLEADGLRIRSMCGDELVGLDISATTGFFQIVAQSVSEQAADTFDARGTSFSDAGNSRYRLRGFIVSEAARVPYEFDLSVTSPANGQPCLAQGHIAPAFG